MNGLREVKFMTCGFAYLRPTEKVVQEKRKPKIQRWVGALFGAVSALSVVAGFQLSSLPANTVVEATKQTEELSLFDQLGSQQYADFELAYQRQRAAALLASAEETQREAEALKSEAEGIREDAIAFDLQVFYGNSRNSLDYTPGDEIKTTQLVDVSCATTLQGYNASIRQIEGAYKNGVIGPIAECRPGRHQPGDVIGIAGTERVVISGKDF